MFGYHLSEFVKCLKPDCMRKVKGSLYCCESCQIAAEDHAPWEVGPYDPAEPNWVLVHSEYCEQRKNERGECDQVEAYMLDQAREWRAER